MVYGLRFSKTLESCRRGEFKPFRACLGPLSQTIPGLFGALLSPFISVMFVSGLSGSCSDHFGPDFGRCLDSGCAEANYGQTILQIPVHENMRLLFISSLTFT